MYTFLVTKAYVGTLCTHFTTHIQDQYLALSTFIAYIFGCLLSRARIYTTTQIRPYLRMDLGECLSNYRN